MLRQIDAELSSHGGLNLEEWSFVHTRRTRDRVWDLFPFHLPCPDCCTSFTSSRASTTFIRELLVIEGSNVLCFRYPGRTPRIFRESSLSKIREEKNYPMYTYTHILVNISTRQDKCYVRYKGYTITPRARLLHGALVENLHNF